MTNTRTKLTILILLLTLSFSVIAKPGGEGISIKDSNNEPYINISSECKFGNTVYKFRNLDTDSPIKHVVVKLGNVYYNQDGYEFENQEEYQQYFNGVVFTSTISVNIDSEASSISKGNLVIDSELLVESEIDGEVQVSIKNSTEKINLMAWVIKENGGFTHVNTKIVPSFFEGEAEFFDKLFKGKNLTYNLKLIFFMSTFFLDEVRNSKKEVINLKHTNDWSLFIRSACSTLGYDTIVNLPSLNTIINESNIKTIYPDLIKNQNRFKNAFVDHFKMNTSTITDKNAIGHREATLPYLDIDKNSFDVIYGLGTEDSKKINPYISVYLNYIILEKKDGNKKSAKPILSYLIDKKVNEGYLLKKNYNYKQYRPVTEDEGLSIATAALRYMTWGVEYTPKTTSILENNRSDNMVYEKNYDLLKGWVYSPNLSPEYRSKNYFSGQIKYKIDKPENFETDIDKKNFAFENLYINKLITTPFSNGPGNPIVFSPMGIDTPKTFNYKMLKQNEARKWLLDLHSSDIEIIDNFPVISKLNKDILKTTMAKKLNSNASISYQHSYMNEIDLYKEAGISLSKAEDFTYGIELPGMDIDYYNKKPFLPGYTTPDSKGYVENVNSLYHPNKSAGVDSLGLLMGSVAMSEVGGNFLNVFNTEVNKKLDTYYKKDPVFHVTPSNDILKKPYRFYKSDFERSSILLPSLKMARVGDILVNYTKHEPHVGIIVSADFSGLTEESTTDDYMSKIIVVSIRSGYRMSNVGVWKNSNNVFSGFTAPGEEKNYHLRRLVVKPFNEIINKKYEKDRFEVFDTELQDLEVEIVLPTINNETSHWVPNTGELYKFQSIRIKGNYANEVSSIRNEDKHVTILPPYDQYYFEQNDTEASKDKSNVYRNKGDGFKFYALKDTDAIYLATIKLKKDIVIQEGQSPYEVVYSDDIFSESITGKTKDSYQLVVENDKLKFKILKGKLKGKEYTSFAIRPIEGNIRPGDDFLLRFGKQDNNSINGCVKDEQFIAVYDKKMLWRANLFIENKDNEGRDDWNYLNKWNAPATARDARNLSGEFKVDGKIVQRYLKVDGRIDSLYGVVVNGNHVELGEIIWYGPNEWNYVMNTMAETEKYKETTLKRNGNVIPWEDLSRLEEGSGGQDISLPSAVFFDKDFADRVVNNRVVYDYVRTTSPFEYKYHVLKQYQAMKSNGDPITNTLNTAKAVYSQSPTAENKTAMDAAQQAFDECDYVEAPNKLDPDTMLPPLLGIDPTTSNQNTLATLWKRYDPLTYKPASKNALTWGTSPSAAFTQRSAPTWQQYGKTYNSDEAGVDCGGIIYISEAYEGSNYLRIARDNKKVLAIDANRFSSYHTIEGYTYDGFIDPAKGLLPSNNLHFIMKRSEFQGVNKSDNIKRLIPGDIIYYYLDGAGYHVMIVHDVQIENGDRDISLSDIAIIESTHNGSEGIEIFGAANTNNLDKYDSLGKNWFVGRIKTK